MEHEEERQVVCEEQCIHAHDKTKIGKPDRNPRAALI